MTKLKTLITTILLATSSMAAVASAHPAQVSYGESSSYSARDHRTVRGNGRFDRAPVYGYTWSSNGAPERYAPAPLPAIALSAVTPVVGPRQMISLVGQNASRLRLEVVRGTVFVDQIAVELTSGQMLVQPVGRTLDGRTDLAPLIDLAGRQDLKRVIVYTPNATSASYQIVAC
jgi:hypothetical protein